MYPWCSGVPWVCGVAKDDVMYQVLCCVGVVIDCMMFYVMRCLMIRCHIAE